jgi:outer membrane protein OmpA-like peptidoglycan-associated protein
MQTLTSRIALVAALALGTVTFTGCEDTAAIAASKTTALGNITTGKAKVAAAKATLDGLMKKVEAMPADTAGLADLKAKLTAQKTALEKMETNLGGFTTKVEEASKSGKEAIDGVAKNIDSEAAGVKGIETALADLGKTVTDLEAKAKAAKAEPAPALASFARKLSTGYEVKAAADGIEHDLIDFVEDSKKAVSKDTWFNFDKLTFKTGGAEIDMDKSKIQLENVTEILKAFPKLKLKIGGYTDNTGAADANKKISQQRAEAVKKALVAAGVDAKRLEAEGYGPAHPVCAANDTDECKAKNRRIAVRATEK